MNASLGTYLLLIFVSAIIGAVPPLLGRWNQRQLHLFVAFGAGVFLGAIFFHLLPDALAQSNGRDSQFTILIGFLVIMVVDRAALSQLGETHDTEGQNGAHGAQHHAIGVAALVGLCIHSLTSGIALGLGHTQPQTALVIFIAILSHKAVAAFSLATMFRLSKTPIRTSMWMIVLFAAATPIGALLSVPLIPMLSSWDPTIPMALATGTFMYVATMNLLPEAFHESPRKLSTYVALSAGVALMTLLSRAGG